MPESAADVRPPFLSVPAWDICDEEIAEWSKIFGPERLAAYTARRIRDGAYTSGHELYPHDPEADTESIRDYTNQAMTLLAERGMVRKSEGKWYVICPGRMEPSIRRAVTTILAHRPDLPPALATELDSWQHTLDVLDAPGSASVGQVPPQRNIPPTRPARASTAG